MRFSKVAATAALTGAVNAQRPSNTSICDYYTTALLKENSAKNQLTVLTLLVNTVVIGNYTKPNIEGVTWPDVTVPGILKEGKVGDADVNLAPYFTGALVSTNRDGKAASVNFLDSGGAEPLMMNKAANDNNSNQGRLLNHLYQFFGAALGCSQQGKSNDYPAYQGVASQYEVHKYMALDNAEVTYFINQVALAAESFGVAKDDITAAGTLLDSTFNRRCSAAAAVIPPDAGPQLQAICIADDCKQADNPNCSAYAAVVEPASASGSSSSGSMSSTMMSGSASTTSSGMMGSATGSATGSASGSASATPTTGAAARNVVGGVAAGAMGIAAFLL